MIEQKFLTYEYIKLAKIKPKIGMANWKNPVKNASKNAFLRLFLHIIKPCENDTAPASIDKAIARKIISEKFII